MCLVLSCLELTQVSPYFPKRLNAITPEVMDVMEVIEVELEGKVNWDIGSGLGWSKKPVFLRPFLEYCVQL